MVKWGTWKILLPYKILTLDFFLFHEITGITKNVDCFHSYIFNVNTKKMNRFIWSIKTTSNESAQVTFLLLGIILKPFFSNLENRSMWHSLVLETVAFCERKINLFYLPTSPWLRSCRQISRRVYPCFMAKWQSKVLGGSLPSYRVLIKLLVWHEKTIKTRSSGSYDH